MSLEQPSQPKIDARRRLLKGFSQEVDTRLSVVASRRSSRDHFPASIQIRGQFRYPGTIREPTGSQAPL